MGKKHTIRPTREMLCQSVIWAGFGLPVSVSGTLAERLLWPWATERSARPQSGILSGVSRRSTSLTCSVCNGRFVASSVDSAGRRNATAVAKTISINITISILKIAHHRRCAHRDIDAETIYCAALITSAQTISKTCSSRYEWVTTTTLHAK